MKLRLMLAAILAGLSVQADAAAFDYDLLIVACRNDSCRRVAQQTVSGSLTQRVGYDADGLQVHIETLAARLNEVDTRVSLKIQTDDLRTSAVQPRLEKLAQRLQVLVEPRTLKRGIFIPLSSFASEGTFYRIWARLADIR
ncbi:MAG: hypothetical protein HZC24_02545 [Rhodocyclales bacterium]|nr:hypothetical protein [Rhodocyclales bacterium]